MRALHASGAGFYAVSSSSMSGEPVAEVNTAGDVDQASPLSAQDAQAAQASGTPPPSPRSPHPLFSADGAMAMELRRRTSSRVVPASAQPEALAGSGWCHPPRLDSVTRTSLNIARDELGPPVSALGSIAGTVAASARQYCRSSHSSQPLQQALSGDLASATGQDAAHAEVLTYGRHAAELGDRVLPFLHSVLRTGVTGVALTVGAGRGSGTAAGDVVMREFHDHPQSGGVFDEPLPAVEPSLMNTALSLVTPVVLGAVGGAVGSLLGEFIGTPLTGLIGRQFHPIDPRAIVPDGIVQDMNALSPGAGDQLRQEAADRQWEITNLGSSTNVRIAQNLFSLTTAARWATVATTPLGVSGQISAGLATVGSAGMLIGTAVAIRQSVSTLRVPDAAQLRTLVASQPEAPAKALSQLMHATGGARSNTHEAPLFYARHMPAMRHREAPAAPLASAPHTPSEVELPAPSEDTVVAAVDLQQPGCVDRVRSGLSGLGHFVAAPVTALAANLRNSPLLDPQPSIEEATPRGIASRALHTGANLLASGLRRGQYMIHATAPMVAIGTATSALAQPLDGLERRAMLAVGNALGIRTAAGAWFPAVANGIPEANRQIRRERQAVVDAQARERGTHDEPSV